MVDRELFIMSQNILFHIHKDFLADVQRLGFNHEIKDDEILVVLPDLEYQYDHYVEDPDAQLCEKYGIDSTYLIRMETVN